MLVHYQFASESCVRQIETPHTTWGQVRYQLESRHLKTKQKTKHAWSFLLAMSLPDWLHNKKAFSQELALKTYQKLGGSVDIVLFRKPYPAALSRDVRVMRNGVYVPLEFRPDVFGGGPELDGMTEDDKIAASMAVGVSALFRRRGEFLHPADYKYQGTVPVPHEQYVCEGCGAHAHHFRVDCPRGGGDEAGVAGGGMALDRVKKPYGIPKSMLRVVDPAECDDLSNLMRDDEGNFVVRVDQTQPQPQPRSNNHPTAAARDVVKPEEEAMEVEVPESNLAAWFAVDAPDPPPPPPCALALVDTEPPPLYLEFEAYLAARDAAAPPPTRRPRKHMSTCTHWLRGLCVKGEECDFLHDASPYYMPICKFYKEGKCDSDELCMFRHVAPPPKRPPMCQDYVKGFCAAGPTCTRDHIKRHTPLLADWEKSGLSREHFRQARAFF